MAESSLTQEHRLIAVETPLGKDALVFRSMRVDESLGRLFEIQLELLSSDFDIDFSKMLGGNVTVRMEPERGNTPRYFNGFVTEFSLTGTVGNFAAYRATLRPWLWFLTRTADCRIYQEQKVTEILESVFKAYGFQDYELPRGEFAKWNYCVQYRETAFNFVSRLMEQEGIYYYFEHQNGKHVLKLCTPESARTPFPEYKEIPFFPQPAGRDEEGRIYSWELTRNVLPKTYALKDYNYEKSSTELSGSASSGNSGAQFEIFDYPGEYAEPKEGGSYSKIRLEELHSEYERVSASADIRGIACGHVFTLKGELPRKDQGREYLVVSATHTATSAGIESGEGAGVAYGCSFEAMDSRTPYRAARITPKPVVQGPQTAVVVGPSNEEIHTDEMGRVKVQFHWDRYGKADDKSSCWVRVGQSIAGKTWGAFVLPRIGQEVVVEFLEGDPDRPLVTGSVYNDVNVPPFDLPNEKNRLGLRSHSTKQGGGGFNELMLDDTKDKEQVVVHAQKDMHVKVLNDRHDTIVHDLHVKVDANRFEQIKETDNLEVGGDRIEKVDGDLSIKIEGNRADEIGGDHSETTDGDIFLKATNIVLEATSNITLKVGSSSIVIEAGGITIKTAGPLEAEGSTVKVTAQTTAEFKASATAKLDGGGMTEIKGGMVKIN